MLTFEEFLQLPCYVINLDRNPERWEICEKRIQEAGFTNYKRISGVDGKNSELLKKEWELLNNPKFAKWDTEFVTYPGKQGCFLSHFKIWKDILDKKIPYAIVFEDDVLFHPQWKELAKNYFDNTPKEFDIVYLGAQFEFHSQYHIDKGPVFCTHAMLVSYSGIQKLYSYLLDAPGGVYTIDCMIIDLMKSHYSNPRILNWYVWNARSFYPSEMQNMPKGWTKRNCGLIFQDEHFGSEVRIW